MNNSSTLVLADLKQLADPKIAHHSQRFFKTGVGEYGYGDQFLGIRVPDQRKLAKKHRTITLEQAVALLHSEYHEARLTSLFILIEQYQRADTIEQQRIIDAYLANTDHVNNWDLVDSSAHKLIGDHALNNASSFEKLRRLVKSDDLWQKRIAMIATYAFIKAGKIDLCLEFAEILKLDDHDLIQKAVGWMLREAAKVKQPPVVAFLRKHKAKLPRILLRYAIERFPKELKQELMSH